MQQQWVEGEYFDGRSAAATKVQLAIVRAPNIGTPSLAVRTSDGQMLAWDDPQVLDFAAGDAVAFLTSSAQPDARILVPTAFARHLIAQRVARRNSHMQRRDYWAVLRWAMGLGTAAALATLAVVYGAPHLARWVPDDVAAHVGETTERQVVELLARLRGRDPANSGEMCASSSTDPVLKRMATDLSRTAGIDPPVRITLYRLKLPNAFALPGNRSVATSGLLTLTTTPDQFAAVLSHEAAHLYHHDPMTGLFRSAGLSSVLSVLLGGGTAAGVVESLVLNGYSREVESRADATGLRFMADLGWQGSAMAEFFATLDGIAKDERGPMTLFSSHPPSAERAAAARRLAKDGNGTAAFPADQWQALRRACGVEG